MKREKSTDVNLIIRELKKGLRYASGYLVREFIQITELESIWKCAKEGEDGGHLRGRERMDRLQMEERSDMRERRTVRGTLSIR